MKHTLNIDIETYSSNDLRTCGVYKYVEAEDFEILLFAYKLDGDPVKIVDLASGETLPREINHALLDPNYLKTAFNAQFERVCISRFFHKLCFADQWECSMVKSAMLGLPLSLDQVAKVLKLSNQKDAAGKALIRYFSIPCKPTASNGMRTRNMPFDDFEKWESFKSYCMQDVNVEAAIRDKLAWFQIPAQEKKVWELDQKINDTGIALEPTLIKHAIQMDADYSERLRREAVALTGLDNPNSVSQLKTWIGENESFEVDSLNKDVMEEVKNAAKNPDVQRMLELRTLMAKSSIKKYQAMENYICGDSRAHGLTQYYGANRTGRWCLTGDHEILTKTGWVNLHEWRGGEIACWNPNGEIISFQTASPNIFDYSGEMTAIESQRCSQISTPEHKMPVWTEKGWEAKEVKNLIKRFAMAFTGYRQIGKRCGEKELRVIIMTQADGHYTEKGIRYHFSKKRKIERCKTLLRRAEIPFVVCEFKTSTTISIYYRDIPVYLRSFRTKEFDWWMIDEDANTVIDELEHWDAYRCGPNSIQYVSTIEKNVDIIQTLCVLSGLSCTKIIKRRTNDKWSTAYIANIWLTPGKSTQVRREYISNISYSGPVYCPTTTTGFFMVRRNGKVWVTGNSGRGVQIQNLPRIYIKDIHVARNLVYTAQSDMIELLFDSIPDTLSQLIRTAFRASYGHRLIVADFSAIEARVIAWLAGEKWRLEVFQTHGKIYEASASAMFRVPLEEITEEHPLRQKGKISELALGFGGSTGALVRMGALKMGLTEDELPDLVARWRGANKAICSYWNEVETAALEAVENGPTRLKHGITFQVQKGLLFIGLPSGRKLAYYRPEVRPGKFGNNALFYQGLDQTTKQWKRIDTFGGKLVENIVQAISRDLLAEAMLRLDSAGYNIVGHVHDEIIIDQRKDSGSLEDAISIMTAVPGWAKGLPVAAKRFESEFYKK
jgi:hypothetical protein